MTFEGFDRKARPFMARRRFRVGAGFRRGYS
jgi:hypothetical protein